MASQRLNRFKAEISMLTNNPPPGIICRHDHENSEVIMADITGPPGSPFEKGTFTVEISLSDRYPFTPPNAKFITPVYHPNVDTTGRICLSGLKPKPAGTWNCSMNIAVILSAIRLLLSEPNLGDPLMTEIATEYKDNFSAFRSKAEAKTLQYACSAESKGIQNDGEQGSSSVSMDIDADVQSTASDAAISEKENQSDLPSDGVGSSKSTTLSRSMERDMKSVNVNTASNSKSMSLSTILSKKSKHNNLSTVPVPTASKLLESEDDTNDDSASDDDFEGLKTTKMNPRKKPRLSNE